MLRLNTYIQYGVPSDWAKNYDSIGLTASIFKATSKKLLIENYKISEDQIAFVKNCLTRHPIDEDILQTLLEKNRYSCCLCKGQKSDAFLIHHIEPYAKTQDNSYKNLAVLCPSDHDLVHREGQSLTMRITKEMVRKSKRNWEENVQQSDLTGTIAERESSITLMSDEKVIDLCKTAIIILEIDKIRWEYEENKEWKVRENILRKLNKYSKHSNEKIAQSIFTVLLDVAQETRHGISEEIAFTIEALVLEYYPSSFGDEKQKQLLIQNGKICAHMAFCIAYDSFIYTGKFKVAQCGLGIFKTVYQYTKQFEILEVLDYLNEEYQRLEDTLRRPERDDLGNAQEFTTIFRKDIATWGGDTPELPPHLYRLIR